MVKNEEEAAHELHLEVCETALQVCDEVWHGAVYAAFGNPSFSPADLGWISEVLNVTIRCTCSAEARSIRTGLL